MRHAYTADCSLVFPPDPVWVRTARHAVRTLLLAADQDGLSDLALLLTSEVVTNAVNACRAGACAAPVTVYAEWALPGVLRVLVHDDAPGLPAARPSPHPDDAEGGRGIPLLATCAPTWGIRPFTPGPGKAVWFELPGTGVGHPKPTI